MQRIWWKEAVFYQVYPRSFCDSNGDGIGDLAGIASKAGYLKDLGIDAVWLSPVYRSPWKDGGYDISDYRAIADEFGTLEDWDSMRLALRENGIRLVMDLVANHTSDAHPWFAESRTSRESARRDWYIWRDGKDGGPPNNWESFFSGSAWTFDPATGQYYLHLFAEAQPDLNWQTPAVRDEFAEIVRFWLGRGIDGFRLDAVNMIAKNPAFPDAHGDAPGPRGLWQHVNRPELHDWLRELRDKSAACPPCVMIGETSYVTPDDGADYTDPARGELDMVIQFEHMELGYGPGGKWTPGEYSPLELKRILTRWQEGLQGRGWNCNYLGNHDQPRQVSRFGNGGKYRYESATMLATMIHLLQGTPFLYQGEELGMTNCAFERFEDLRDVDSLNWLSSAREQDGFDQWKALELINRVGRDNARTPMQWDAGPNAGFTAGTPWIPVNPNYPLINAEEQTRNPHSVYSYYKKLILMRHSLEVVVYGTFHDLQPDHPQLYVFTRTLGDQVLLVLLNLSDLLVKLDKRPPSGEILLSNYCGKPIADTGVMLPYEAQVVRLLQSAL